MPFLKHVFIDKGIDQMTVGARGLNLRRAEGAAGSCRPGETRGNKMAKIPFES